MSSRGRLCPGGIHRGTDGQGWLLLYTDGLMETRDRNGELFDLAALGRQAEAPNLEHTLDPLLGAVTSHAGGTVNDDVAVLVGSTAGRPTPALSPPPTA